MNRVKKFILIISGLLIVLFLKKSFIVSCSQKWITIKTYEYDLTQDGENEIVSLMVLAESDEEGDILWEDGHLWRLDVRHGDKKVILYENFLTFADLDFEVGFLNNNNKPSVLLIIENHVLITAIEFFYLPIENQFASNELFYFIKAQ
jgi:hypothetical protein